MYPLQIGNLCCTSTTKLLKYLECFPFSQNVWFTGWNANLTSRSNGNFLEQTDDLLRYSTYSIPASQNRNYYSICRRLPFPLCCLLVPSSQHQVSSDLPMTLKVWNKWEKPFHLTQKLSRISNKTFWLNGKCPREYRRSVKMSSLSLKPSAISSKTAMIYRILKEKIQSLKWAPRGAYLRIYSTVKHFKDNDNLLDVLDELLLSLFFLLLF